MPAAAPRTVAAPSGGPCTWAPNAGSPRRASAATTDRIAHAGRTIGLDRRPPRWARMSDEACPVGDDSGPVEPQRDGGRYTPPAQVAARGHHDGPYVSLSSSPSRRAAQPDERGQPAAGASRPHHRLALVLAHHVAFRMSTRLVNEGLLSPARAATPSRAQALGGIPVAVLGSIPVFLLGEGPGRGRRDPAAARPVVAVGYRTARFSARPIRALGYSDRGRCSPCSAS